MSKHVIAQRHPNVGLVGTCYFICNANSSGDSQHSSFLQYVRPPSVPIGFVPQNLTAKLDWLQYLMFYKLYVLRDFFGNLTYGNPIPIYDCGQFLERCCQASSRSLTSCQQSPKTLDAYMKSRKQLKSPNIMCKYFYLRAVRKLAWLMECLYSEDQIQLYRRKLAVVWLPEHYFNIWIPRCVLFVRFWFCSSFLC